MAQAALPIASLVLTAVGTGVAVYGQQQQAASQEAVARYNYELQQQNAKVNAQAARQQYQLQEQTAVIQAQQARDNATVLQQQATAKQAQAVEETRRMRERNERLLASQESRFAKSGVTSEGTPLIVQADTLANLELGTSDLLWQANSERGGFLQKADQSLYDAKFSDIDAQLARYYGSAAESGFQIAQNEAGVSLAANLSNASATRFSSYGTILGGLNSGINTGTSWYDRTLTNRLYKSTV